MGQPQRVSRRKVVTLSSDNEEKAESYNLPAESSDDEPVKAQKRSTEKLKSAKKSNKTQQPSPATSTQDVSSQKSPAKANVSKSSKTKTAVKEQPKPNAKPIYSFFNAATQKLQSSQPSASPEKLSTQQDEPELIQDDSDSATGSGVQLSKGSSTALALRKRKIHNGHSFDSNEFNLPPQASQKFRKATNGDRLPSFSALNEDKRPWTEQFAPNDLSELAVHKRKVADVRQWLEMTLNGHRQRVLVLKGAAGTGKTTTIRLLTRILGLAMSEWKNPVGAEMAAEGSMSAALQFEEFIGRAGRVGGLTFARDDMTEAPASASIQANETEASTQHQLLLVEEFPNTFSRTSSTLQSFRSAILQYLSSPPQKDVKPTPLVLIVSETLLSTNTALADSFTSHRLLGPELSNHPFLTVIEFNAIAQTFLLKALETIVLKEARKSGRRRTPGPAVLKRLAQSGDIRSAVSALEFLCLRGDSEEIWSSKITFTKTKKSKSDPPLTQAEEEALKLISNRESTLGIFHAVGKVVYNKRMSDPSGHLGHPPPWLPQHHRDKVPENNIDILIDELGTDTSTFLAALHENYALSCSSSSREEALDSLSACMDSISDSDLISADRFSYGTRAYSGGATDGLRQDEMAFQVSVRGLWFSLPYPVHRATSADTNKRDAHQMFYPASLKIWRQKEEVEGLLQLLANDLQVNPSWGDSDGSANVVSTSASGVERWKQNTVFTSTPTEVASEDSDRRISNSAKTELLLERLPFVAQVLACRKAPSKLLERLNIVTHVRSSAPNDDDSEDEQDLDEGNGVEQWTTDHPDADSASKPRKRPKAAKLTSGGGLGIPVESRVEKLVLQDDDIED